MTGFKLWSSGNKNDQSTDSVSTTALFIPKVYILALPELKRALESMLTYFTIKTFQSLSKFPLTFPSLSCLSCAQQNLRKKSLITN